MQAGHILADVPDEVEQQRLARQHIADVDVLVPARDDRLEDRVVAPANRRDLEHGALPDPAVVAVELGQWAFALTHVRRQISLDDDLGLGGDHDRHGDAGANRDAFPADRAGDVELVAIVARAGRDRDGRVEADDDRNGQRFVLCLLYVQELTHMPPLIHVEAQFSRPLHLHSVVRQVAAAAERILAYGHAAGDERPAVADRVDRDRQLAHIHGIAGDHVGLPRRRLRAHTVPGGRGTGRRDALGWVECPAHRLDDLRFLAAQRQGGALLVRHGRRKDRPRRADHRFEEGRRAALTLQRRGHVRQLMFQAHRPANARQLTGGLQHGNIRAQIANLLWVADRHLPSPP